MLTVMVLEHGPVYAFSPKRIAKIEEEDTHFEDYVARLASFRSENIYFFVEETTDIWSSINVVE